MESAHHTEPYGIDFGTRNTAAECSARLTSSDGSTIPSAVAYDSLSSEIRFGHEALGLLRSQDPEVQQRWSIATSFKTALESDMPFVRTQRGTKTAAQVLSDYLRCLVDHAAKKRLPELSSAVFSIPVGFGAKSRRRLLEAARGAGIEPRGVVSESTAAYLKILHQLGPAERVAVVDWGAGTLDVSILRITGSTSSTAVIEERACKGSTEAGDCIDMAIYEALVARLRAAGTSVRPVSEISREHLRSMLHACENAKIALSDSQNRRTSTDLVFRTFAHGDPAKFTLTADDLREISAVARKRVFEVVFDAIQSAGLSKGQLDRVIFVGGCTGLLGFDEDARRYFGPAAVFPNSPEWVVAAGALEVAKGYASYRCLQNFGCVLDDGSFLSLIQASEFNGREATITVAATESTELASLVFAERQDDRVATCGALGVPLLGHIGEPVHIRTTLRHDLTVGIDAWSHCSGRPEDVRSLELLNTRFQFEVRS